MGWAFDKALRGLSAETQREAHMRQDLALCILRLFDEGENDPLRLSTRALAILTVSDRERVANRNIASLKPVGIPDCL